MTCEGSREGERKQWRSLGDVAWRNPGARPTDKNNKATRPAFVPDDTRDNCIIAHSNNIITRAACPPPVHKHDSDFQIDYGILFCLFIVVLVLLLGGGLIADGRRQFIPKTTFSLFYSSPFLCFSLSTFLDFDCQRFYFPLIEMLILFIELQICLKNVHVLNGKLW